MFEVLEHTEDPISAVNNIYEMLDQDGYVLFSSPFIFHIHDEPYDFYRFTKYGLKHLFRDFKEIEILSRNGWFETILVLFVRLRLEKSLVGKIIGNAFILLYYLLTPVTWLLQKTITSDKMTTGYFLYAKK
jgi:2-polyprenyl-3-methyl-5-hydroxy-6-metoxy-1,4-benzoquinol methylase